jgi:hypothetical protein
MTRLKRFMLVQISALAAVCALPNAVYADDVLANTVADGRGPANGIVLLIRHAEKPEDGTGLAPLGVMRAESYVRYFASLRVAGSPMRIHTLVAAADSPYSSRSRLTLTPLGRALGLPVRQPFANREEKQFAQWLASAAGGRNFLVAWHHGTMPKLLANLGADPDALLPRGDWPDEVYDWVIVLRFGSEGRLVAARRIVEPRVQRMLPAG